MDFSSLSEQSLRTSRLYLRAGSLLIAPITWAPNRRDTRRGAINTEKSAALRRELWSMVDKESVNAATETTNHRWSAVSPFADPLKMEIQ